MSVCQIESYEDGDRASAHWLTTPVARVDHVCGECDEAIIPGETYERSTGIWNGSFEVFKTCATCKEIRAELFCSFLYGVMWDDIRTELQEYDLQLNDLGDLSKTAMKKLSDFVHEVWGEEGDDKEIQAVC